MGEDPELRNNIEYYELTPHEQHENLWKRVNVLFKKHYKRCFVDSLMTPPYIDWPAYF